MEMRRDEDLKAGGRAEVKVKVEMKVKVRVKRRWGVRVNVELGFG